MAMTLLPKSPRTTIALVVVLVGALVFVITSGPKKHHGPASAPLAAASEAAQALADLAVPGPDARSATPAPTGGTDTTFAGNPFLSLGEFALDGDPAGDGGDAEAGDASLVPDVPQEPLHLQGTVVGEGRAQALINGRYVSAGQFVAGWKVSYVGPREARLEHDGRTLTLKVDGE